MTVGRLLEESSSVELSMWQHYYQAAAEHEERRQKARKFEHDIGV